MDHVQRNNFNHELESLEQTVEFQKLKKQQKEEPAPENSDSDSDSNSKIVPAGKWKAPEGWTPPGWDDKKSMQAASSFMKFQVNPTTK